MTRNKSLDHAWKLALPHVVGMWCNLLSRNPETALALGIELKTVKNHLTSLYHKLGVAGRYQAIAQITRNSDHLSACICE